MKACRNCLVEKPPQDFTPAVRMASGLNAWCKACCAVRARGYRAARAALRPPRIQSSPERNRANEKAWRQANKDRVRENNRAWRAANPEKDKQHSRDKYRRYKQNPTWRLIRVIRAGMWKAMKGEKGSGRWFDLLDYTPEELRSHLERQFLPGMSWGNFGEWHIDHIRPMSSFRIAGPDDPEFRRAWGLTNLRPLWGADNMSKGARIVSLL